MEEIHLNDVCRLCMWKDSRMINIFDGNDHLKIPFKIRKCLPITVSRNDFLPKIICARCMYKLDMLSEFWETCLKTQKILLSYVSEIQLVCPPAQIEVKCEPEVEVEQNTVDLQQAQGNNILVPDSPVGAGPPSEDVLTINSSENADTSSFASSAARPTSEWRRRDSYNLRENVNLRKEDNATEGGPGTITELDRHCTSNSRVRKETSYNHDISYVGNKLDDSIGNYHTCNVCNREFSTFRKLKSHSRIHVAKSAYVCGCDRKFTTAQGLALHKKYCNKGERFSKKLCNQCGETFPNKTKLHFHMIKHHVGKYKGTCHVCSRKFVYLARLKEHLKCHKKPHECKICKKTYQAKSWLVYHVRQCHREEGFKVMHAGTNGEELLQDNLEPGDDNVNVPVRENLNSPRQGLQCTTCGKKLPSLRTLLIHEKGHLTQKPYKCLDCGEGFKWLSSLEAHRQKHQQVVECDLCERTFLSVRALRCHLRFHDDSRKEKEFKCELCDEIFLSNLALKLHVSSHTDKLEYKCQICNNSFKKNRLSLHAKFCHPLNP